MRDRGRGAAEPEPMLGGDIAFGDGEEAGEPRLGRQQIVAIRIEFAFRRHNPIDSNWRRRLNRKPKSIASAIDRAASSNFDSRVAAERAAWTSCPKSWLCASIAFSVACAQNSISAPLPSPRSIASAPAMSTMISALA